MRPQLKYWRDLPQEQKKYLMAKYNIKVMTFEKIEMIYKNKKNR